MTLGTFKDECPVSKGLFLSTEAPQVAASVATPNVGQGANEDAKVIEALLTTVIVLLSIIILMGGTYFCLTRRPFRKQRNLESPVRSHHGHSESSIGFNSNAALAGASPDPMSRC